MIQSEIRQSMIMKLYVSYHKQTDQIQPLHPDLQKNKIIKDALHYNQHTSESNKKLSPKPSYLAVHNLICTFHIKVKSYNGSITSSIIYIKKENLISSKRKTHLYMKTWVRQWRRSEWQTKSSPYWILPKYLSLSLSLSPHIFFSVYQLYNTKKPLTKITQPLFQHQPNSYFLHLLITALILVNHL